MRLTRRKALRGAVAAADNGRMTRAWAGAVVASLIACAASSCSLDIEDVREVGPDGAPCTKTTCEQEGKDCGSIVDGCGGVLFCGLCDGGETCGADAPNVCGNFGFCNDQGCPQDACGLLSNGCDGVIDCGECRLPETCGGGGEENRCGCTPPTCAQMGAECGYIANPCDTDQPIHCGACSEGTCGAGGKPNRCGDGSCQPYLACDEAGANCGVISDGCEGVLACPSCANNTSCGGGGVTSVCGCKPPVCGDRNCGQLDNPCGPDVDCGTCDEPETCGGSGVPGHCGCIPRTCASLGANCGAALDDGCGGTIACGPDTCPIAGDTCGGGGQLGVCGQACTPSCPSCGGYDGCGGQCPPC